MVAIIKSCITITTILLWHALLPICGCFRVLMKTMNNICFIENYQYSKQNISKKSKISEFCYCDCIIFYDLTCFSSFQTKCGSVGQLMAVISNNSFQHSQK